jgi:hypothetical protein
LIETKKVGRSLVHELTDKGWRECRDLFGADTPARSSGQGKALYTLLGALDRYITRGDLRPADLFWAAVPVDDDIDVNIEERVREAYSRIARLPGAWVGLARLRTELVDIPRASLDEALARMYRHPGISLIPEENQKALERDDHEAAVEIGEQRKHLIAIEP